MGDALSPMATTKHALPVEERTSASSKSAEVNLKGEESSSELGLSDIQIQLSEDDLKRVPKLTVIKDKIKAELESNSIPTDKMSAPEQVNTLISLRKGQLKHSIKSAPAQCENTEILPSDLHNDQKKILMQLRQYIYDTLKEMNNDPAVHLTEVEFSQLKQDMSILLNQLRNGSLADNLLITLTTTMYNVQRGNFQQATSSYLQLSIGNVAWPMGVKATNIHSRKGDDKITKGSANISKNDGTERWLLALKRLITYKERQHLITKRNASKELNILP